MSVNGHFEETMAVVNAIKVVIAAVIRFCM
jgi:hypothetical protein